MQIRQRKIKNERNNPTSEISGYSPRSAPITSPALCQIPTRSHYPLPSARCLFVIPPAFSIHWGLTSPRTPLSCCITASNHGFLASLRPASPSSPLSYTSTHTPSFLRQLLPLLHSLSIKREQGTWPCNPGWAPSSSTLTLSWLLDCDGS